MLDGSRKQKQCQANVNCEQNKTAKFCYGCRRSVCGKCTGCVKVECVDWVERCNFICFCMLLKPLVVYVNGSMIKNNHSI